METIFSSCFVKEVVELQHFSSKHKRSWACDVDEGTNCGFLFAGRKMLTAYRPQEDIRSGNLLVRSAATEEQSINAENGAAPRGKELRLPQGE